MYPSSPSEVIEEVGFDELWARVARVVPYAAMEDKLFWRRLEARKVALDHADASGEATETTWDELLLTLRDFDARLHATLAVRLALLGDSGRSKVA